MQCVDTGLSEPTPQSRRSGPPACPPARAPHRAPRPAGYVRGVGRLKTRSTGAGDVTFREGVSQWRPPPAPRIMITLRNLAIDSSDKPATPRRHHQTTPPQPTPTPNHTRPASTTTWPVQNDFAHRPGHLLGRPYSPNMVASILSLSSQVELESVAFLDVVVFLWLGILI